MTWYPDVSLESWLRIHPDLKMVLPYVCDCGKELEAKPYVSSEWIGIESSDCSCANPKSFTSGFQKNKQKSEALFKAFTQIIGEE